MLTSLFLSTLAIILFYTTLFYFVGKFIFKKINTSAKESAWHPLYIFGTSFFIGYAFFLSIWYTITKLTSDAKYSLLATTFIAVIVSAFTIIKNKHGFLLNNKQRLVTVVIFCLILTIGIFKALIPMPSYFVTDPEYVSPFAGFGGVGHSFRAGNISEYIVSKNNFPIINQHSGQSILASIPMFIGYQTPQLSLVIWLNIFISFFALMIYGFGRKFIPARNIALIPPFFVLFGNTVISPFYSSITDTGSALILNFNIDSLFGIATFFVLIFSFYDFTQKRLDRFWFLLLIFIFGYIWNITSGQMIILFIATITITSLLNRHQPKALNSLFQTLSIFLLSSIIGASQLGGMLLPVKNTSDINIPGLMEVQNENKPFLAIRYPRTNEGNPHTWFNIKQIFYIATANNLEEETAVSQTYKDTSTISTIKSNNLFFMVAKIVRSIQIVFFPLLGLFLAWFFIKKNSRETAEKKLFTYLTIITSITFLFGFICSSIFEIYGYYWELSKFFYFGSFSSMLILGLVTTTIYLKTNEKITRIGLIILAIFIMTGPTLEYFIVQTLGNIYLNPPVIQVPEKLSTPDKITPLPLSDRLKFLIESNGFYGK